MAAISAVNTSESKSPGAVTTSDSKTFALIKVCTDWRNDSKGNVIFWAGRFVRLVTAEVGYCMIPFIGVAEVLYNVCLAFFISMMNSSAEAKKLYMDAGVSLLMGTEALVMIGQNALSIISLNAFAKELQVPKVVI